MPQGKPAHTQGPSDGSVGARVSMCVEVHAPVVTARNHAKTAFSFKTPWWGNSTIHLGLVSVEA